MESNYSKRELDDHFNNIRDRFLNRIESIDEKIDKIIEQTTRHNGRMSRLEAWRNVVMGAMAVMTLIVIPMMSYFINKVEDRIATIEKVFTSYNITIE